LAIFVSCIGLFALSAYITSLRTKEIGVRKVLGASVSGVVMMLSKDFTKMILLALVLAVPVAWVVMEKWWLQGFAYRVNVGLGVILVAGTLCPHYRLADSKFPIRKSSFGESREELEERLKSNQLRCRQVNNRT
jgi:predicted lysophospholipase L1 biosynthesis ABC-type transport system permease subunit